MQSKVETQEYRLMYRTPKGTEIELCPPVEGLEVAQEKIEGYKGLQSHLIEAGYEFYFEPVSGWEKLEESIMNNGRMSAVRGYVTYRTYSPVDQFELGPIVRSGGFDEAEDWNNGFRAVWLNCETMQCLTYVEGDLTLENYHSPAAFCDMVERAEEFYQTH